MTVAELIARLQGFPQDLPVYVWDDWTDFPLFLVEIMDGEDDIVPGDHLIRPRRVGLGSGDAY